MKNVKIILTAIFIVMITIILSSSVYAGTVNSIDAKENGGKITVSGTVDSSVYAVAVVVYSGNNLEYMKTANVNTDRTYNTELEKKFDEGTYEVRVADYNGGEYKTVSVEVKKESATTDNTNTENEVTDNKTADNKEKSSNPKTGDNIVTFAIIFVIAVMGLVIIRKINKSKGRISKH